MMVEGPFFVFVFLFRFRLVLSIVHGSWRDLEIVVVGEGGGRLSIPYSLGVPDMHAY